VFAAGVLLLGGPVPALLAPHSMVTIVAVSVLRGFGFGLSTVVIGALVASSVPPERRGEGIGLAGVVACVPAIVALPSGVWLAQNTGYAVVIAITAVSALAPLAAVPWLGGPADRQAEAAPAGLLASLRSAGQLRPAVIFAATTVSAGVVASFLPLAAGVSAGVAALGLFAQAVTATASRWRAGRRGDRHGHARLLIPGLLIAAAGMTSLIWVPARLRGGPHHVRGVRGTHRLPGGVRPDRAADPRRPAARVPRPRGRLNFLRARVEAARAAPTKGCRRPPGPPGSQEQE